MSTTTMSRRRHAVVPGARKAPLSTPAPAPDTDRPTPTSPNSVAYLDFLYGFGAGTEVDLGVPKAYAHVPTTTGSVFREDFERGIALCNCGEMTAEVALERAYFDQDGTAHTSVSIPPHTVKVFFNEIR